MLQFTKTVIISLLLTSVGSISLYAQQTAIETYCNPVDLDYTYMIYNSKRDLSYRSGADPAVVEFKGEYYMFVTRSLGYWHSTDLQNWNFIESEKWYFQGCNAPAAHNYKDSVLYVTGDPSGQMSVIYTDNPKRGDWKIVPAILTDLQDPALFIDDDHKAYLYWGSSNKFPIRAKRLDMNKRFIAEKETTELFNLVGSEHGWERFGENHQDNGMRGYIEGPWMTKHNGTYYLQYAAPGTQFNVYADGVYTSKDPMGPFTYQPHNPVTYKPGGFMNGAGHGCTVVGPQNSYWHFASMALSVNEIWERRLSLYPIYFDDDGLMYSDTRFGDYPHYSPAAKEKQGEFRGWMLLSYKKPVTVSSVADKEEQQLTDAQKRSMLDITTLNFEGSNITDENVKTFWLAKNNREGEWITIDLESNCRVNAIQVNFHDHKSDMYGRYNDARHRYTIEGSLDGDNWFTVIDKKRNYRDEPNDYEELAVATETRYLRYTNYEVPTPNLAISEIRVFGKGSGKAPTAVKNFTVTRQKDRRDAMISWSLDSKAQGYNVLWGIAPDKLYSSWMVYGKDSLDLRSLSKGQKYYFAIESFNENGVSKLSKIVEIE